MNNQMTFLNLTKYPAADHEKKYGVYDLEDADTQNKLNCLLGFSDLPSIAELEDRAKQIAQIAQTQNATCVVIKGFRLLMLKLETELDNLGIEYVYPNLFID